MRQIQSVKRSFCVGVVYGAALAHQIRQKEKVVGLAYVDFVEKLPYGAADYFLRPPFHRTRRREHTPHKVEPPVCVTEDVHTAVGARGKFRTGGKHDAAGAERDEHTALFHRARADSADRLVAAADYNLRRGAHSAFGGKCGRNGADYVGGFENRGKLCFADADEVEHRRAPPAVFHVEIKRTAVIGYVAPENSADFVGDVILRQHYFRYLCEVVRFVLFQPHQLGRRKARERHVARPFEQFFSADFFVEISALLSRAVVVPEYRGTDDVVICVEHDKSVHLSAERNAFDCAHILPLAELADAV